MAAPGRLTDQTLIPPMVSLRGFNRFFFRFFLSSNPDKSVFEHRGPPLRTGGSGAQGFPTRFGPSPFREPVKKTGAAPVFHFFSVLAEDFFLRDRTRRNISFSVVTATPKDFRGNIFLHQNHNP